MYRQGTLRVLVNLLPGKLFLVTELHSELGLKLLFINKLSDMSFVVLRKIVLVKKRVNYTLQELKELYSCHYILPINSVAIKAFWR